MAKVTLEDFGLFYPTVYYKNGTHFTYDMCVKGYGIRDCIEFAEYWINKNQEIAFFYITDAQTGEIAATVEREEIEIDDDGFEIVEEFEFPEDDYPEFLDDDGFEIIDYFIESEEF